MTNLTIGDLAKFQTLTRSGSQLKAQMDQLSTEVTTGLTADETGRLKGNYVQISGIESSLSQIDSYSLVTSQTQVLTSLMQTSIGSISDQAKTMSSSLLGLAGSRSPDALATLGQDAANRLNSVMSALNTRSGQRTLFAGKATATEPLASSGTMLDALQAAVTALGAQTADEVQTAVDTWFADPAGFQATIYKGADAQGPVPIGRDQTAQIDVTATDPALVATMKGLATAALISRGVLSGSNVAQADLAQRAGTSLAGSQEMLASLSARLGTTEATVQNAATQNDAEKSTLEQARLNLLSVDPYETASKYQETQNQLQTLYELTSRASKLSMVNYL